MKKILSLKSFTIIISILLIFNITGCFENENRATDTLYKKTTTIGDIIYEKSKDIKTSENKTEYFNETFIISKDYHSIGIMLYIDSIFVSELSITIKNPNDKEVFQKTKTKKETEINEKEKIDSQKGEWEIEYKYNGWIEDLKIKIIGLESNEINISDKFKEDREHDWIEISTNVDGWGDKVKINIEISNGETVYKTEISNGSDIRTINSLVGDWKIIYESSNWSGLISLKVIGVIQGRDESQEENEDWWSDTDEDDTSKEQNENNDKDETSFISTFLKILLIIFVIVVVLIIGIFIGKKLGSNKGPPNI